MSSTGYANARQMAEQVASTLDAVALLIGKQTDAPTAGCAVDPGLGLEEDAASLRARARDLRQGSFTILVIGEFKNGKSTLLNAMLGSKTLPAKAAPATAVITVLVHGDREEVLVVESGSRSRRISWEEFIGEFQLTPQDQETIEERGRIDRFAAVEYVEIERRHALCAQGVKLVDSPGLGEHLSRTRVATNFLKQSQAVIMVLNATRILTQQEREFIDDVLGESRLSHVFFVVNRMQQVDPNSVADIQKWVRAQLEPHFRRVDGSFDDDLYRRRVYFVDARAALDARSTAPPHDARLEESGVPALERELEHFLTGGEKLSAMLQSTCQSLRPIMAAAGDRIRQTRASLDSPLEALEQRHAEATMQLDELDERKRATEETIRLFGDTVKEKVFADLRRYLEEMQSSWEEDSRRMIDLDRVLSLRNVVASYTQEGARERMTAALAQEVQRYVQTKFDRWSQRVPSIIERDITVLMAEVEAQIDDLQLELDRISALFAGTTRSSRDRADSARLFQLALSLDDIGSITDDALTLGDPSIRLGRVVQQSVVFHFVLNLLTGSLLSVALLTEVIQSGLKEGNVKKRIRGTLGERLVAALREQLGERREFIYRAIEERFDQFAAVTTEMLARQIDEVRADQQRILQQKRDQSFSIDREKHRLSAIGAELQRLQEGLLEIEQSIASAAGTA